MNNWELAKKDLANQMTLATFNDLFKDALLIKESSGVFTISVPSASVKARIEGRLNGQVGRTLASVVGKPARAVFVVNGGAPPIPKKKAVKPTQPKGNDLPIAVRDKRKAGRYFIDTVFIRGGYAAKVGAGGIAVYNILAASADNDYQDCYPSYAKIADLAGISKSQAKIKIKELEVLNIISIEVRRNPNNPKLNDSNLFTLLDDEKWVKL